MEQAESTLIELELRVRGGGGVLLRRRFRSLLLLLDSIMMVMATTPTAAPPTKTKATRKNNYSSSLWHLPQSIQTQLQQQRIPKKKPIIFCCKHIIPETITTTITTTMNGKTYKAWTGNTCHKYESQAADAVLQTIPWEQ